MEFTYGPRTLMARAARGLWKITLIRCHGWIEFQWSE